MRLSCDNDKNGGYYSKRNILLTSNRATKHKQKYTHKQERTTAFQQQQQKQTTKLFEIKIYTYIRACKKKPNKQTKLHFLFVSNLKENIEQTEPKAIRINFTI